MDSSSCLCFQVFVIMLSFVTLGFSQGLSPFFYNEVCPQALPTICRVVEDAVRKEPRMGASLLRLHFHDCFVNGCDGSILLDSTSTIDSEKNAVPNKNSARGFEVIDEIKSEVDKACGCSIVSCADILTVAARDSVVALGGPTWLVPLGRRDSTTASRTRANNNLPPPTLNLSNLINNFGNQGLNIKDLVVLSGGHTLGFAQCLNFKNRIYNESNIDPAFAQQRKANCPPNGGDTRLSSLDFTPATFDTNYFQKLVQKKGLLHSDQQLFNGGGQTDQLVRGYSLNGRAFGADFANSMIKMGNIKPLTGTNGQIRTNCRRVN